ncbi:MAG: 50S ribosomal protein L9 [Hyphomicrobiaceae bacterium]
MQIILLERIAKLGQMGDVVTVKDGFARNFLLPQGKALRANKTNKEVFERDRAQLEARNLEAKKEAEGVAEKLDGQSFIIIRQAGDTGQLYGSVSTRDISEEISEGGFSIDRRQVLLDRPIKALGLLELMISLHPEVEAGVTINVARSADEAERQARGEDISALDTDDEADEETLSAEDVFEEGVEADVLTEEDVDGETAETTEADADTPFGEEER